MDDLYGDLEETDATEEFDKIRTKNQILEDENTQLKKDLHGSTEKCGMLETENEQLKNNISSLFKTAQGEIIRKEKLVNELRTELENLKFRRLGSHNKQFIYRDPNSCNTQVNPKNDFNVKAQPVINKLSNPSIIEPERDSEEQQTPPVSGFNESRPNNAFTCNNHYEDPRLQRTFSNNNSYRNIPTTGMIDSKQKIDVKWHLRPVSPLLPCREERTAELQPENLYGNIVPKHENKLITQLLPNDTVKTEDLDILELDTRQEEFSNDKDIPEISESTDRKRKRYSPSPLRKIPRRNTPDSDQRKNSPGRNRHRLVSKSRSRENYTSQERQSRSPRNTRRFSRDNDRSIDNTWYGRGNHDQNSRNRESSHPRKKRISFKSSDHNNELRHSDNRRRNYEENDYHGRECHGFLNKDDRKKVDQYGRRSPPQRRETYKDHRNKQISSNLNSSGRFSSGECSKDLNENENKRLSAKNDNVRERGKEKFSEQGLSSNKSANHDDFNDRNAHFRKKSPVAKDVKHGQPFEPLKHILNLYIDSEKGAKHQDYDKKRNHKAVGSIVKKKTLSLEEYNKRHNSANESDDITDTEIKKGSTTKVNSNSGCVELKNIRVDGKSDPLNEYVDLEDGEVLSDQGTDLLQNLEEKIDHQIQEHELQHIVTIGNPVTPENFPKESSLSESQSSADKIVDACSNPSKLAEINESKKIHKSKISGNYLFSNESKETNATHSPLHLKLLSDVACDSRASHINIDDRYKTDDSNNKKEFKPRSKEDTVTITLSDTSTENNIAKYIHKKKCVPNITVINSETDVELSECPILPSVSASVNRKVKTILHENTTIKKSKIPDYENKKHKINSSAVKRDKTSNSYKLSKKLNTTDTSSRIHFNEYVPTKIKSKPIHDVPDKNSCDTSNVIMTQYKNNEFVTMDKAVNNSEQNEQNTPVDVIKSNSKIGLLLKEGATSQTVLRNSKVSDSPDDSCMNYSEIIPTDKCDSNVPKNLPIIGGTRETVSKNSIQLYNNIVNDSLMNDLMKISPTNFTDIQIRDSKVPEVIPVKKDSRETILKKKNELSNTAVYDSLIKDFTKISQNNPTHADVPKALPIIRDAPEDISDKSKKLYHNAFYDSLIMNIIQVSQNNTSDNKILGDSLIKDNVETCQTITTDIIESFNMKEKDLSVSNIINSLPATSATIECDGKLPNNSLISEKLDVSSTIFSDSLYNSKLLGNTPVMDKQIENKCQTITSHNTLETKILEDASNKNVELVSDVIPINLIQHFNEILDYSYTKEKTITADCDTAGSKILENVSVIDKVNIPLAVSTNIDKSKNKIFLNSMYTNNINSVQNSILPVEKTIGNHDTNMNKTVTKVEPPKNATPNSNTVHFKIARRRNVAIKSSHTK